MVPTSSSVPGASQRFSLDELKSFASRLADRAGEVTLDYFRRSIDVENKSPGGGFDPVTAADRQAEQAIRELIEATFPDHGIFGEEGGTSAGRSP